MLSCVFLFGLGLKLFSLHFSFRYGLFFLFHLHHAHSHLTYLCSSALPVIDFACPLLLDISSQLAFLRGSAISRFVILEYLSLDSSLCVSVLSSHNHHSCFSSPPPHRLVCSVLLGVGSQLDFLRGAALSVGGLPIIAMRSVNEKGESNIVNTLKPGAGKKRKKRNELLRVRSVIRELRM